MESPSEARSDFGRDRRPRDEREENVDAAAKDMRGSMHRMTSAFLHQAEDAVAGQQSMLAAVLRDVARSLRKPGEAGFRPEAQKFLQTDGPPILVAAVADALETGADRVETADIRRIGDEAGRFFREQPLAAAGLAALAGLALTRIARTAAR